MSLVYLDFFSMSIGMNSTMTVIIPDNVKEFELPVLYLYHPSGGNHTRWVRETSVERCAEKYGMAVVMPNSAQGYFTDMKSVYNFYAFMSEEIPEKARCYFPRITNDPQKTYIAGVEIGGYGAIKAALRKVDAFNSAVGISAITDIGKYVQYAVDNNRCDAYRLLNIFGSSEEVNGSDEDLFHLVEGRDKIPKITLFYGKEDRVKKENELFAEKADAKVYEFNGCGNWDIWSDCIEPVFTCLQENREG